MDFNRSKWLYLVGFFLILFLPLLNLPPWFSPPDWGKTIVFRIVLGIMIFVFLWEVLSGKEIALKPSLGLWFLFSLFGIFFLATIFSLDPHFSFWGNPYRSGGFLNFAFYIIFAILAFLILKKSDWQKIWDFAISIGILVSVVAIFQWQGWFKEILITFKNRPPSTVGGPIFLAIYLLLLTFLTLSFGIKSKNRTKKAFYFLSFLLFLYVILITWTRAAYIGLAVGFLWFLFAYPKRLLLVKIPALILLILGIYGIYYLNTQPRLPEFVQENKILRGTVGRLSIERALQDPRISGWKVSWEAIKDRSVLGYGPENFSIGFDKFYDPSLPGIEKVPWGVTSWWDRAHNFIFDISLTAGIPALIIYLSLFGVLFWRLQKLKRGSEKTIVYHSIQATFLAYLAANFFSFDTFSTYLISFLLIGFSLSLVSKEVPEKTLSFNIKGKTLIILFLFVSLIWFIWAFNIKPLKINAQINLAGSLVKNEKYELAFEKMEKMLSEKSFLDAYLRLEYADFLIKYKQQMPELSWELVKKARELLKKCIRIQPYHTSNYIILGSLTNFSIENETNLEIAQSLKKEGDSYFEKANELSPKRQEVFIEWIKSDLISGEHQKAKEKAQKCIDLNERLSDCWWLKGLSNIYLNKLEEAKENIEIAGKKGYPINSEDSLLKLAKVYLDTENYQKLIEIYKELIKIKPSNPDYYVSLMIVYKEIGDFEKAKKEALKILELFPEYKEEVEKFLKTLE